MFVDPQGIEPCPLDFQSNVRTSYTKGPSAQIVGIEPTQRGFGDLPDTLSVICIFCGENGDRTHDTCSFNAVLYSLSYLSFFVPLTGYDPVICILKVCGFLHLSYGRGIYSSIFLNKKTQTFCKVRVSVYVLLFSYQYN